MSIRSYVYCITNKTTKEFYFGSRYANVRLKRSAQDDLWKHYKTSSATVKSQIEEFGEASFDAVILIESDDFDDTYWFEQERIKENIRDPLCLNKFYKDKKKGHKVWSAAGAPKTLEHRKKIGDAQRGKGRNGKPLFVKTPKTKEETSLQQSKSAIKKHNCRSLEEKNRIASLQSASLSMNHAMKSAKEKEATRLKKIASFAAQTDERRAEINNRRAESARKRWETIRLSKSLQSEFRQIA